MTGRSYLSIGDVLTLLREEFPDVTISKIRFLESQGLVNPERSPSGYRKFFDTDVERLRWVLRQQREHFLPLKVIRDRLADGDLSEGESGSPPVETAARRNGKVPQPAHAGAAASASRGASAGGRGALAPAPGNTATVARTQEQATQADDEAMARILADATRRAARIPEGDDLRTLHAVPDPAAPAPHVPPASPLHAAHASPAPAPTPGVPAAFADGDPVTAAAPVAAPAAAVQVPVAAAPADQAPAPAPSIAVPAPTVAGPTAAPADTQTHRTTVGPQSALAGREPRHVAPAPSDLANPAANAGGRGDTERVVGAAPASTRGGGGRTGETSRQGPGGPLADTGVAPRHKGVPAATGRSQGGPADRQAPSGAAAAAAQAPSSSPLTSMVTGASLTAEELCAASGLSEVELAGLQGFGLIEPLIVAGIPTFDEDALTLANVAAAFRKFGIEPRHLRLYRNAVDREMGLIEQVIIPLLRQRNPESRQRAVDAADELGSLGQTMRATLMRTALRRHVGG
jgi:DNA-binding transcriptional MerR regulator